MFKKIFLFMLIVVSSTLLRCGQEKVMDNLLSLQEGTFPIIAPANYSGCNAELMLDESATSGWASKKGNVDNNQFVFEMVNAAELEYFEFDNASIDKEGAGAKDITVEVSNASEYSGYELVLKASLAPKSDNQKFNAQKKVNGRFVRLTIINNHGSDDYTVLFSFRGYGIKPTISSPSEKISGTYQTNYSKFHVRQQGTALIGCYEYGEGILEGTIEGRVMKITWKEKGKSGPAIMVFANDGKSFKGYWWYKGSEKGAPKGIWIGEKISQQVGTCPHWSGSISKEIMKQISTLGKATVYGILFDFNSAVIKNESLPILSDIVLLLQDEPELNLIIEGHTNSIGTQAFNQKLSEQRALSVKTYLVNKGINANRLQTKGFGSTKPIADNSTEIGRAQNRRVELIKQ